VKPSDLSSPQGDESDIKSVEEVDLLWKVGRRQEAVTQIDKLLSQYPNSSAVLEMASFIYLDLNQMSKARDTIKRFKEISGDAMVNKELQGQLLTHEKKWTDAYIIYDELYRQSQDDKGIIETYADLAARLHFWSKAGKAYEQLLGEKFTDKELLWAYRRLLENHSPKVGSRFTYYNRPSKQDDYIFQQQGRWGKEPWLQWEVAVNEEFYNKESDGTIAEIDEMVTQHSLAARFYYQDALSLAAKWDNAYNSGHITPGGSIVMDWEKEIFSSHLGYEANQLVRDPIEAIMKETRMDRLKTNNRIRLGNRMEVGNETTVVWYRVDGNQNTVNGEDDLGHNLIYDNFWSMSIWDKPYVSVNYHFKRAHWDKKFNGAETVVDFLSDEQVHSAGLYLENKVGTFMDYNLSGTYNTDVKRNVDYIYWSMVDNFWIAKNIKFSILFEFLNGDSGVSGKGDSQAVNALLDIYF